MVFGGGDASALAEDNAQFVVADNDDPGIQYGLSLANAGDAVTLVAADGVTDITTLAYGDEPAVGVPAPSDESAVLDPEVWGSTYLLRTLAPSAAESHSPGTLADVTPFEGPEGRYAVGP